MTKDDELAAAPGRPVPKRVFPSVGRKTAPAGTPYNKLPTEVAAAAVASTSSHPPSGAQNTMTPPRTVGGHTARLFRGEDADLEAPDVIDAPRPRVRNRAALARAAVIEAVIKADDDEETLARIAAKAKAPPAAARSGTVRMDASDRPPALGPATVASARRPPPAAPGPPPKLPVFALDSIDDDVPSTARGGSGRDLLPDLAPAPRPAPAPLVMPNFAPVPPPVVAAVVEPPIARAPAPAPAVASPPPVVSTPTGEISISGSELEATAPPPQELESRWPFAFAVGAVSLAVGSLLPLPFRQYIVRDRGPAISASASASASPVASTAASAPAVVELRPTPPHPATPVLPSALAVIPPIVAPPATSAARPPTFGTAKTARPTPTTPKDVF